MTLSYREAIMVYASLTMSTTLDGIPITTRILTDGLGEFVEEILYILLIVLASRSFYQFA